MVKFPDSVPSVEQISISQIGEYGFFCAAGDWVRKPETPRAEIHPRPEEELAGVGRWLHSVSDDAGDLTLGKWICHLFGVSTCPKCHKQVDVAVAVAEWEKPAPPPITRR